MKRERSSVSLPDGSVLKELVRIRNLLMFDLLVRRGFSSEDVDLAVRMGPAAIRRALPVRHLKRREV